VRTGGKVVRFLKKTMLAARCAAALGLLVVMGGGCAHYACPGFETANQSATFQLSCGPTDLVSVALSGPCSDGDASISDLAASASFGISSPSPGVCHVTLTFATGFTYSADVTFILQNDGDTPGCPVWHYTAPTQRAFTVNNPSTTCVGTGLDAGSDGRTDAASQVVCPSEASQSVPCALPGSCTGCRDKVAFDCTCVDADDSSADGGGLQWQCIDTGFPCMQGGP
jgi:hypothetical protein